MKKTKVLLLFTLTLLFTAVLVACSNPNKKAVNTAKENLNIAFTVETDTLTNVTGDLTLPVKQDEATVTWVSSKPEVVSVLGKVNRPVEDTIVKLTATLIVGKEQAVKDFDVKVIKLAQNPDQIAIDQLKDDYADTLGNKSWKATENVELVAKVNDLDVTWKVESDEVYKEYFTVTGKVTRPTFTTGDATIKLRATIGEASHLYFFIVQKLDQTVSEKIQAALNLVTIVPSSGTEFQEIDFDAVATTKIDGQDVAVTWVSSNVEFMEDNGKLVPFPGDVEDVSLTASITFEGVTLTKTIDFKVKGLAEDAFFDNLADVLKVENVGKQVFVTGVTLYAQHNTGYYLASKGNTIVFINGKSGMPTDNAVYNVKAEVDNYHGTFQLKNLSFTDSANQDPIVVVPEVMTFADVVARGPQGETAQTHYAYKIKDVYVLVTDEGGNYNTFLTKEGVTSTTMNKDNAIMIYYPTNIDVLRALKGRKIASIDLIANLYRSDKLVYYAGFHGTLDDLEIPYDANSEIALAEKELKNKDAYFAASDINMPSKITVQGQDVGILWTTDNVAVIGLDGKVIMPAEGTNVEVTLTATFTASDLVTTKVFTYKILVGSPDTLTITEFIGLSNGKYGTITGVISGISSNGTYTMYGTDGKSIAVRLQNNVEVEIGTTYTFIARKSVFSGLHQAEVQVKVNTGATVPVNEFVKVDANNIELTNDALLAHQSSLLSINDMLVSKYAKDDKNNVTMTLIRLSDNQTISFRWDSRVVVETPIVTTLANGDVINLVGAPLGWFNNPQIGFSDNSQIVKILPVDYSDDVKNYFDASELTITESHNVAGTIELEQTLTYGSTIEWSYVDAENINNNLVDLTTGAVSIPKEGQVTVKINAKLTTGESVGNKEFVLRLGVAIIAEIAKFDFRTWNSTATGSEIKTEESFLELFNSATTNKTFLTGASELSKIYAGNGTGAGLDENNANVLKTGTSGLNGTMKLSLSTKVSKVVIVGRGWKDTDKLTINGVSMTFNSDYSTGTNDNRFGSVVFELEEPADLLNFLFEQRILIQEIQFWG